MRLLNACRNRFALALAAVLLAAAPARARADRRHHQRLCRTAADRDHGFLRQSHRGSQGRRRHRRRDCRQPGAQWPVPADRQGRLHSGPQYPARGPTLWRLAPDQCPGPDQRRRPGAGRRAPTGRVPALGRVRRDPDDRARLFHHAGQLAPRRPHHHRRDLQAADRRRRLFRHPSRLHRRERPPEPPGQAARDHGPGRRQPPLPDRRRLAGVDPALLADHSGDHLSFLRLQGAAGLSVQSDHRPAGGPGRFSRHDLRTALLARRQSGDHELGAPG